MVSGKINKSIKVVIVVLLIVISLGSGLVFGYKYVLGQTTRFKGYEAQVKAKEAAALAAPSPTPISTQTDKDGNIILPTDKEGNEITAPSTPSPTPMPTVNPRDQIVLDVNSPGAVMILVANGDSTSDIAKKLKAKGVIDNTALFTIFSKINGFDGGYQYGTHFVRKGMSFDQIMFILTQQPATRTIRFHDDYTYADDKKALSDNGVGFVESRLNAMVNNPTQFMDYRFIKALPEMQPDFKAPAGKKRDVLLQGYLFPDTYHFDLNADDETIIRTFLDNFDNRVDQSFYDRAAYLHMTMDQVITLASVIQKESGDINDMYKVSRVFHNRLDNDDFLQSCATINYIRKKDGKKEIFIVGPEDLALQDPYNTYKYKGLPPGPICSPNLAAITAALYPATGQNNMDLYYFSATGKGNNVFATTGEEHEKNIEKYLRPLQESAATAEH